MIDSSRSQTGFSLGCKSRPNLNRNEFGGSVLHFQASRCDTVQASLLSEFAASDQGAEHPYQSSAI